MNDLPHDRRDRRSSARLLVRAGRLALAAVPVWLTLSFVTTGNEPVAMRALVGIVALVAAIWPAEGLCIVAATAALAQLISLLMKSVSVRLSEALVAAFLAGWLLNPTEGPDRGPAPNRTVRYTALALGALILASMLRDHFTPAADASGAVAGGPLLEGLGLSAAVVVLLRRRPILAVWIPVALGAGCVIAVVAGYRVWHGYAFGAAASYFALMLCLASGVGARERGGRRIWWVVVAGSAVVGLWLSGSGRANETAIRSYPWFGVAVFAALLVGALWPPLRAVLRAPHDPRLLGLVAGVTVFLLIGATGDPFLTPEVAFPFWLAAGLMVALGAASPGIVQ